MTSPSLSAAHTPESVLELAGTELASSVFRTVNALLASPTDAEEVTLDTLVQLHERLGEIGPDGLAAWIQALPAWLDKAAVTRAKGRTKKRKRHSDKLEELVHMQEQLRDSAAPKQATAKLVREILSYFPGRHRFCVVLQYGLGHGNPQTAELLAVEEATVTKSLDQVKAKLRQFSAHAPIAGALLEAFAGSANNPLRDYMEHYGAPDDATQARLERRFQSYLREGSDQVELTGEYSYHDGVFSDSSRRLEALLEAAEAADVADAADASARTTAADAGLEPAPSGANAGVAWIIAGVAVVALLGVSQYKMVRRLEDLGQSLAALEGQTNALVADEPLALEPGEWVNLEHDSRAEPSKDARVKLLRSDAKGAEFELETGSISLHVKPVEGVEWLVHVGEYQVIAFDTPNHEIKSTRFRVTKTEALPAVGVFQGKVQVSGGELGDARVVVTSAVGTLAAAMAAQPDPGEAAGATETSGDTGTGTETEAEAEAEAETEEDLGGVSSRELFTRAVALRETNEAEAETLLWVVVERGEADEITEQAFEQLRSLVPADARLGLSLTYAERFPNGPHAEDFAAMGCRATPEAERDGCWREFREAYPDSLY